jgi:hypothetical protein
MRLNSANQAFVAIVFVAGVVFGVFVGTACWVFSMILYRLATGGVTTLTDVGTFAGLVLIALLVAASLLATRSFRAQAANTRRLSRWVRERRLPLPPAVAEAAQDAGLADRVGVVDAAESFSFAYGMGRPRVVVSRGLVDSVAPAELAAVLHHERYHVTNYDPLKVVLARSLPEALFFLPALGDLRGRYVAGRELAADRRAVRKTDTGTVAGALFKVVGGPPDIDLATAAAIGGEEALDARVSQLESGSEPPAVPLSRGRVLASVGGAGVLVWAAIASFASFAPVMAKLCTGR